MNLGDYVRGRLANGDSRTYEGIFVGEGRAGTIKAQLPFFLDGEPLDLIAATVEVVDEETLDRKTRDQADAAREKFHFPRRYIHS